MEAMAQTLQSINTTLTKLAKPKNSLQLIVSNNKSEFTTRFESPIYLDPESIYEVALVNLETYFSFPNIDDSNNTMRYSVDGGKVWIGLQIPEGCYELTQISKSIQNFMKQKGHINKDTDEPYITISSNSSTLKSIMEITGKCQVDFNTPNSLSKILGFEQKIYSAGYHESKNIVDIMTINSIFVHIDLINGSYVDGKIDQVIYNFFPNVSPGYKIVMNPTNLVYLPVNKSTIDQLYVKLTDQNGKLLNLRGEKIIIRFHLREC